MKRIISVLLCVILLALSVSMGASAISINSSRGDLIAEFQDGACSNGVDYAYYSPVKENDNTKYPLLVWIHGMKSGTEPRLQIRWYGISNWASDEYQAKFDQGGCFIFAPRATVSAINNWDVTSLWALKSSIDEFIAINGDNIDTNRIYIAGYSTGGVMVWEMLNAYPDFFAAAIPSSAITQPAASTLSKLKDTSVWIFCCDKDNYPGGRTEFAMSSFGGLKDITARPDGVRITYMSEAVLANGNKKSETVNGVTKPTSDAEHYTWEAITYDMHMANGDVYAYSKTIDGNGNEIDFSDGSGVISWLTKQARPEEPAKRSFIDMIRAFFSQIINFFKSLFKI